MLFSNLFVSGQIHQMSPNSQALLKNHFMIGKAIFVLLESFSIIFLQLNVNFPVFARPVLQKLKIAIFGSQESVFRNVIMIHFQKMRIIYTLNIQKQRTKFLK